MSAAPCSWQPALQPHPQGHTPAPSMRGVHIPRPSTCYTLCLSELATIPAGAMSRMHAQLLTCGSATVVPTECAISALTRPKAEPNVAPADNTYS